MNRYLSKEDTEMENEDVEKKLILPMREMNIETLLYRLKMTEDSNVGKEVEYRKHLYITRGDEKVQPLWKTGWQLLRNVNRVTPWSSNSTAKYTPEITGNRHPCEALYMGVRSSIIYNSQKVKQTKCQLTDEWVR